MASVLAARTMAALVRTARAAASRGSTLAALTAEGSSTVPIQSLHNQLKSPSFKITSDPFASGPCGDGRWRSFSSSAVSPPSQPPSSGGNYQEVSASSSRRRIRRASALAGFGQGLGGPRLRVRSVHAADDVDVVAVLSKAFVGGASPIQHEFGRTGLIVRLPEVHRSPRIRSSMKEKAEESEKTGLVDGDFAPQLPKYVAVFRFGSVVFFNVPDGEANRILEDVKRHGTCDPQRSGRERTENFEVAVVPGMVEQPHANGDFATVRDLDLNTVAVISKVLAQTVALDSYGDTVDDLLATFASINSAVQKTGTFSDLEKEILFKVVAQNNSLFIDMIGRLGIKDRSETAWNLTEYERVWEDMKDEFEIEERFGQIEFKLNLIQQNAKFFLGLLHHQKSNSLEWVIIVLIAFEGVLMCLDMSGLGTVAFKAFFTGMGVELTPPK